LDVTQLYSVGIIIVIVGVVIMVLTILASLGKNGNAQMKGAAVIMIGPIPIVFGSDKKAVKTILALALALTVALIVLYYFLLR
jgi:uncharacterized protein (TIGR00304 family)